MTDAELVNIKTRSRHRLIGAFVLVLVLVIGVPLLLDHQAPPSESAQSKQESPILSADAQKTGLAPQQETISSAIPNGVESKPEATAPEHAVAEPVAPAVIPPLSQSSGPSATDAVKLDPPAKQIERSPGADATPKKTDAPNVKNKSDAVVLAAPAASTPETAPKPDNTKGWFVQLGVFAEEPRAHALQDRLREHGVNLQTDTIQGPRGTFTRLRAGPFTEREAASTLLARIKALGENAILVHQ
jgi:DedD protein